MSKKLCTKQHKYLKNLNYDSELIYDVTGMLRMQKHTCIINELHHNQVK